MPIDTLSRNGALRSKTDVEADFQKALRWHMDQNGTSIAEVVRSTGVSRDVINKLRSRDNASTTVENGVLIAAYFGKTVNEFLRCEDPVPDDRDKAMLDLLRPTERRLLAAQIEGLLRRRAS